MNMNLNGSPALLLSLSFFIIAISSKYFIYSEAFTIPKTIIGDRFISDFMLIGKDTFLLKIDNTFALWNRKTDN